MVYTDVAKKILDRRFIFAGRKDIKAEFQVMASALSKEKGMMRAQLNRWKDAAQESLSLREEARSLKTSLDRKV